MNALTLYKDKPKLFEASIQVNGASLSDTSARLILNFDDNTHIFYTGTISKLGECKIQIPPLKKFDSNGNAVLEVIVDSTVFVPWKSKFELKQSKTVTVEVKNNDNNTPTLKTEQVIVKVKDTDIQVKEQIKEYIQSLTKSQLKELKRELKNVILSEDSVSWKRKVFKNDTSYTADLVGKLYHTLTS